MFDDVSVKNLDESDAVYTRSSNDTLRKGKSKRKEEKKADIAIIDGRDVIVIEVALNGIRVESFLNLDVAKCFGEIENISKSEFPQIIRSIKSHFATDDSSRFTPMIVTLYGDLSFCMATELRLRFKQAITEEFTPDQRKAISELICCSVDDLESMARCMEDGVRPRDLCHAIQAECTQFYTRPKAVWHSRGYNTLGVPKFVNHVWESPTGITTFVSDVLRLNKS
jgi:hypothetical protein